MIPLKHIPATNMKKIILIIGVLWSIGIHSGIPVNATPSINPFSDLPSYNPYFEDILTLYEKGLLEGYQDTSFRPQQLITRSEFVKMVLGIGECIDCRYPPKDIKQQYTKQPFPDIYDNAWYFYCIAHAQKNGIVTGYLEGTKKGLFYPEDPISRAESIAILLRSLGITPEINASIILHDVSPNAWYYGYIQVAIQRGLIPYHNGFIAPDEKIARDEFAHLIMQEWDHQSCTEIKKDFTNSNQNGPSQEQGNNPSQDDSDGDGTRDDEDLCPHIPGDLHHAKNIQGCPSINEKIQPTQEHLIIQKPVCTICPCPTLEYKADIRPGDIFFTTISSPNYDRIYSKSNPYLLTP